MKSYYESWTGSLVVLLVLSAVGCGGAGYGEVPVSGQVTYNGEPLANVHLSFQPIAKDESLMAATEYGDVPNPAGGFYDGPTYRKNHKIITHLDKKKNTEAVQIWYEKGVKPKELVSIRKHFDQPR